MASSVVSIGVCVVLPVAVVLITSLARMNSDNRRSQVLMKAIESNDNIDPDKLEQTLDQNRKPKPTARELLNQRLLRGCIFSLLGLLFIIIGIAALCTGTEFSADAVTVPMLGGGASLAVGISYLIVYFVTRGQVDCDK